MSDRQDLPSGWQHNLEELVRRRGQSLSDFCVAPPTISLRTLTDRHRNPRSLTRLIFRRVAFKLDMEPSHLLDQLGSTTSVSSLTVISEDEGSRLAEAHRALTRNGLFIDAATHAKLVVERARATNAINLQVEWLEKMGWA
jgi:hypothetical protein